MKRVNLWTPHPTDGTSFYRAWGVFNQIARNENLPIIFESTNKGAWNDFMGYDLIFMHRPHDLSHVKYCQLAKRYTKIWMDWDDDILNIPTYNPTYNSYKGNSVVELVKLADMVTTSTQPLLDSYNADGHVIENYIPLLELKYNKPMRGDKFRIVWRGSNTHDMDWYTHIEDMSKFLNGKKDVEFVLIGDVHFTIEQRINQFCGIRKIQGMDTSTYFEFLQGNQVGDLLFVPLQENLFNKSKSDCAVLEGLVNGMISITPEWNNSDTYTYKGTHLVSVLNKAYNAWKNDYSSFSDEVVSQQAKAKQKAKINYQKRLNILKNILSL
jgi:hypothetical protein